MSQESRIAARDEARRSERVDEKVGGRIERVRRRDPWREQRRQQKQQGDESGGDDDLRGQEAGE